MKSLLVPGVITPELVSSELALLSPHSGRAYERWIGRWLDFLKKESATSENLKPLDVVNFLNGIESLPSKKQARAAISWLYSTAINNGWRGYNPTTGIRLPSQEHLEHNTPALGKLTLKRLEGSLGNTRLKWEPRESRDRALLKFFVYTLAREGAVSRMKIADITLGEHPTANLLEKGGKQRRIPLFAPVVIELRNYLSHLEGKPGDYPLWPRTSGKKFVGKGLSPSGLNRLVGSWCARAGLDEISSPHVLRASGMTLMCEAGLPIESVARLAGHKGLGTVGRYVKDGQMRSMGELDICLF